ncbi:flagellar biosynthetic protein FliR [uncultured Tateyamaria sp.]|uniref:flagellar biosynthetic protein FliR n=1 Tax=uncultured Tateyamaria sp. TaxID=455651 RepID=UPI00261AD8B9|nr:flagellar biosynthetic protein FliR [uncultured Tateyamaria sp.]
MAAAEAISLLQTQLWLGFVVFLRVGAAVALLPGFGEQSVPVRIKLVVAIAFTLIVAPALPQEPPDLSINSMVLLVATETVAGVLIGLGVRLFTLALQTAGAIAAQSTSLSQILGGASIEPLPAMGYVLSVGAIALAVMAGLHIKAAHLLIHSYVLLPMGLFSTGSDVADWGLTQVAHAFELAFLLAAPFVLMSVLYNLALGVINKAMPQLMVAFVGAPVITLGGLFLLFLAAPIMLSVWLAALDQFMASPFEAQR